MFHPDTANFLLPLLMAISGFLLSVLWLQYSLSKQACNLYANFQQKQATLLKRNKNYTHYFFLPGHIAV
jgi:hypothetical protein